MLLGARFEKSLAGETTLAAMLVESVATDSASIEIAVTPRPPTRASSVTGSQIVSPSKISGVADVTATPMNANRVIVVGRPSAWPSAWSRWLFAKRVKSGMLSGSVTQKPTMAVSDGKNTLQKLTPAGKCDGCARIGPIPPAAFHAQPSRSSQTDIRNGADRSSIHLMDSVPFQMKYTLTSQNAAKPSASPVERPT